MQTKLPQDFADSEVGLKADKILRSCVHCGFCLATCPTYQLLGNELDSPRGRIYLIKSALEGESFGGDSIQHLDSCLTCRACETTCPSGVQFASLLDIGRAFVEPKRPLWQKVYRSSIRKLLTSPKLFNSLSPLFRHSAIQTALIAPKTVNSRVLLLTGCVQPSLAPNINHATKNVLAQLDIDVIESPQQQCCGAIDQHLAAEGAALTKIKHNIDHWSALLDDQVDCIISTASGCGVMVKDYAQYFDKDDAYYDRAVQVASKTKDIAEYLLDKDLTELSRTSDKVSVQIPCSLQHGQQLPNVVNQVLTKVGYDISPVKDSHLCCGSAGTYSILQPKLSKQLRNNKVANLTKSNPEVIVTANIGCLMHIQKGTDTPVKHWIELLNN
ncbi:glycolate oxidase iron-sulfur subunit [Methylophaga sp. 41_12_T18]|nr:glycolate oxidase iron-sulfur subunit [Methylophaga sp. 41_12_T18]